jgi:hypothetical protein
VDEITEKTPRKAISFDERYVVMNRSKGICAYCGCKLRPIYPDGEKPALDHRVPLALGGTNDISNLDYICSPCNGKKSAMTEFEFICKTLDLDTGWYARIHRLVDGDDLDPAFLRDEGAFTAGDLVDDAGDDSHVLELDEEEQELRHALYDSDYEDYLREIEEAQEAFSDEQEEEEAAELEAAE